MEINNSNIRMDTTSNTNARPLSAINKLTKMKK
jgi:hypothetical protein